MTDYWGREIDYYVYDEKYEQRRLLATCVMVVTSSFALIANIGAIVVVKQNSKISRAVSLLFFTDSTLRLVPSAVHLFYITPCYFTSACITTWTSGARVSRPIKLRATSSYVLRSVEFITLAIALNRFFAVFNSGRYYQKATLTVKWQTLFIVVIPVFLSLPLQYTGNTFYYSLENYSWICDGRRCETYMEAANNLSIGLWCTIIGVDCLTAWIVHRRMDKNGNSAMRRIDIQILKQVFTFHVVLLTYLAVKKQRGLIEWQDNLENGYFELFWFYTFLPAIIDMLAGLSRVYFLRMPKKESPPVKVVPPKKADSSTTSTTLTTGSTRTAWA